ncbi:MAG TPA: thiamine pyrophosphate-dependent enzyme [Candidatus Omnitrophota bacterium]|nr:thiamine pyrophosphate-dependent enzyme [Candidatus Omnitrophota bacterium]HPD84265.1 thiamine pyrophosphate-dependent enzyme [Candidatus Omnitrophota bacterium]HRZ03121.1 thiamine pyrophosphate-dependent enzyme [Candidatus Omnitrophota bacterium]
MSLHRKDENLFLFSGNEALAQGAYESGLQFAAGYPGTPSTEIIEYLSHLKEVDCQWSVNEKVAFEVALAAAIGGKRSLYASKHVGLNVAMDSLMTSSYVGVNAGFVIVSCDDPGMPSSQNEQDSRCFAKVAKIPLLEPSSPSEAKEFVKKAFEISEQFDIPVMVRMTTRICHTKENVALGLRTEIPVRPFGVNAQKYVMVPRNAYQRHINLEERLVKLKAWAEKTSLNKIEISDKKIGFIANSVVYFYAKESYPEASFLKLGMSFPFPENKVKDFCRKVKKVFVLEELEPFLEEHIRALGVKNVQFKDPSFRVGELRPEDILSIVKGKKKEHKKTISRPPSLCLGCPHRFVFDLLKKLNVVVAGDIGCYTLGFSPPYESLHTCLCMGSGITFFEGLSRSIDKKVVGVIGDSTFVHSGITGLINAAYNKTKGTILILDNGTTAMTGGQSHPATGTTVKGELTKQLSLEAIAQAAGADTVDVIDPAKHQEFEELLRRRIEENNLSVIIVRRPCILLIKSQKKQ